MQIAQRDQNIQKQVQLSASIANRAQEQAYQPISPATRVNNLYEPFQTRIQKALDLKAEGNTQFKAGRFQQAKNLYQQALVYLQPSTFYGASEAQRVKVVELSSNVLFNIGSCSFNLKLWKQAEIAYNEAIVANPNYVKAIYKRALVRFELGQIDKAMEDIKNAFSLDKSNRQIYQSYEKILVKYNDQAKKYKQKSKELSSKFFNLQKANEEALLQLKEKEQQKKSKKANWWMLAPLIPLAAIGIYQGIKLFRS